MGHAGDVVATEEQIKNARRGILMQLEATGLAENFDSFADAMDKLNLREFVDNQARVTAQLTAFDVRNNAIINKLTMAGAYVKLDLEDK